MRAGLVLLPILSLGCIFDPAGTRPSEDSGGASSASMSSGSPASSGSHGSTSSSGMGGGGGGGVCGNGQLEPGEACEDANLVDGDGCDMTCAFEATCDGTAVEVGELCDGGPTCSNCVPTANSVCAVAMLLPLGVSSHVTAAGDPALTLNEVGMCGSPADAKRKLFRHTLEAPGRLVVYAEPETADGLTDPVAWLYPGCFGQALACSDAFAGDTGKLLALTPRLPGGTPVMLSVSSHAAAELGGFKLYAMPALHQQHEFTDATLGAGWTLFMNQLFINTNDPAMTDADVPTIRCGGEEALRVWVKHQFVQMPGATATMRTKVGATEQTLTFTASPAMADWARFDLSGGCPAGEGLELGFTYQGANAAAWRIDNLLVVAPRAENDAAPPF